MAQIASPASNLLRRIPAPSPQKPRVENLHSHYQPRAPSPQTPKAPQQAAAAAAAAPPPPEKSEEPLVRSLSKEEEEQEDYEELVEYLRRVRLDEYAARLRQEFNIRHVAEWVRERGAGGGGDGR